MSIIKYLVDIKDLYRFQKLSFVQNLYIMRIHFYLIAYLFYFCIFILYNVLDNF